jgi:peptide/nickel transport system permease protein
MTTFLLRRIALIVPTLFFVSLLIFGLQQLLPGDPATALAGRRPGPGGHRLYSPEISSR